MFISLLDSVDDIKNKTITTDALLTQRKRAHYLFTVKGNQPTLLADIQLAFENRGKPDFTEPADIAHGRIECRSIWTTTALNNHLDFPFVGQAIAIERKRIDKKTR